MLNKDAGIGSSCFLDSCIVIYNAKTLFIEDPNMQVEGLIIGGPGLIKNKFVEDNHLDNRLGSKVLRVLDVGMVSDKEGINELVNKAKEVLVY